MSVHTQKRHRRSLRDHLIAYGVLIVIVSTILVGAVVLYMSGIFDPVTPGHALEDTKLLELATPPPRSLIDWLIPSARAEEGETPEISAQPQEDAAKTEEDDLEALLATIVAEEGGETVISDEDRITVERNDLALNKNINNDVYSILLLGTDARDLAARGGRSDVMIVASVDKTSGIVRLSSLSRDMYLEIPGVGKDKLNAAYAYGGPLLAIKTVNKNFELNIEDYAVVNFSAMAGIVDALGGVDIYLGEQEYYFINYNVALAEDYEGFAKSTAREQLKKEEHENATVHLDGLQSVAYARIRKLDNDLQRGSRQRILLEAILKKGNNLSPSTFYSLVTSLLNTVSTNVKMTTVMELGNWFLQLDGLTMEEKGIPVEGSYRGASEKDMDVIIIDQQTNVQELHQFLFGEYIPAATAP